MSQLRIKILSSFREESAPFTGIYEIKVKTEAKRCGLQLLTYNNGQNQKNSIERKVGDEQHDPTGCAKEEVRTDWREANMRNAAEWIKNFVVKIKVWEKDSEVTYFGKSIHKKEGEWKRTFEIIQDHGGIYSYNIDHIPAYETIMMGVHEGTRHAKMESPRISPRVDDNDTGGDVGLQGGMVSEKVDDMDHTIHNDNGSVPLVDDVDPEEVEQPAGSA